MNPHVLNQLLAVWPRNGAESREEAEELELTAQLLGLPAINPHCSRSQIRRAFCNQQHRQTARYVVTKEAAAVPWKYQKYLKPNQNLRQQATKIQPGAIVPVSFNGMDTTMYVDTARRISFRGKPWFVELKVKLNTEHIPIILTRETKCTCLYCGTEPVSDEDSCRKCGAPLPDC